MTAYFKISSCVAIYWNSDGASVSDYTAEEEGEADDTTQ
jgi:hypothetical protein